MLGGPMSITKIKSEGTVRKKASLIQDRDCNFGFVG